MKKFFCLLFLAVALLGQAWGQSRRPIDSKHPMWLMHVDVWNAADPQKIIDLIPDDVKPYVVMNLSLSCSYDTDDNVYTRPQNGVATYKSWASVCQANNMWFTCQPASGGHTHIQDDDLEIFEYFYKAYPNFLGWNYAEQFWGFDVQGDKSSSSQTTRLALFAQLVEMAHRYGGFLTVSFCGNIWSHGLNPVGMMKRNSDLYNACAAFPEAILWLYKYTTSSCFYNNESVTFGPFVSGLAANYGVRYDNCGYDGALTELLGEDHGCVYPVAAGIGTVMEQTAVNGGAVWDGPELIWTQDFENLSSTTVSGYTRRRWGCFPGFTNAWIDMFRKVIDGTLYIPTRQEVVEKTKLIVINNVTSGTDEDKYATWANLYDGVYKQTDPMNRNTGQWMENGLYWKSTGRYGTIPMTLALNDELAQGIQRQVKKSAKWSTIAAKQADLDSLYESVSEGDLFVNRYRNQLVTYTPYSYLNEKKQASAVVPLRYNTCESLELTWGKLSSGAVHEYADHIDFYLNNYRSDTTTDVTDVIVVRGVTQTPAVSYEKRAQATVSVEEAYDATAGTLTVNVSHNGPVDLTLTCSGDATGRATDVVDSTALSVDLPKQPETAGDAKVIVEAEDMDYKNLPSGDDCILNPYFTTKYKSERGHVGNGFMHMGTSTSAALLHTLSRQAAGQYRVIVRYMTEQTGARVTLAMNGVNKVVSCPQTGSNVWRKAEATVNMKAGTNRLVLTNTGGKDIYIDQVTYMPASEADERFPIVVREALHGVATASVDSAAEFEVVTLTATPADGYLLAGWEVVHGNISISDDNTFEMPDDIVTVKPVFADASLVYEMDLSEGSIPTGWRVVQENDVVHEYPNSYSDGSRIMTGFTNTRGTNKALYWREGYAEYGRQTDYPLTLEPGKYKLSFGMAAWKSTPYYVARILTEKDVILAKTSNLLASPNANGSATATLSTWTSRTLEFEVTEAGNYTIRFVDMDKVSGYDEFLLLNCSLRRTDLESGIADVIVDEDDAVEAIYTLDGKLLPELQRGMNIVKTKNGVVKKFFMR